MDNELEKNFYRIGTKFWDEFHALLSDFYDISNNKFEAQKNKISELKTKVDSKNLSYGDAQNIYQDNIKHRQFGIAMFNYMNAIFERSINSLLRFAISNDESVKRNYLIKFIEFETKRISIGQKPIRNAEFELMDLKSKEEIYLNYFKEVSELLPPLLNYQFFFNISDRNMWKENTLKYDYSEIRARRNLLTHRGLNFDREYVDTLNRSVTTSKNSIAPKDRTEYFIKNKLFTYGDLHKELSNDLSSLITYAKPIPVAISSRYFNFSFGCLLRVYAKLWVFATKSDGLLTQISHDLMCLGSKFKTTALYQLSIDLIDDYIFYFGEDSLHDYSKANYLLAWREKHNSLKKQNVEKYKISDYEEKFRDYFKNNINNPLYRVLIAVCENNLNKAIIELSNCKELSSDSHSWFLFNDLRNLDGFDVAFNKATLY